MKRQTVIRNDSKTVVLLEGLGLCEHCGALMNIENLPAEAMGAEWRCGKCKGVLTSKTFGYEEVPGKWEKTRWVGKDGKWTGIKPTENFDLGNFHVIIKPFNFLLF